MSETRKKASVPLLQANFFKVGLGKDVSNPPVNEVQTSREMQRSGNDI
jgi:hypothetical protein